MSAGTSEIIFDQGSTWQRESKWRSADGPHVISTDGATAGTFYAWLWTEQGWQRSEAIAYNASTTVLTGAIERTAGVGAVAVESIGGSAGAWELTFTPIFRALYTRRTGRPFYAEDVIRFDWDLLTTPGRAGMTDQPIDFTGYTITHEFRYREDDPAAAFSSTVSWDGAALEITESIAAATLAALTRYNGVHKLKAVSGGGVARVLERGGWVLNR